MIKVLIGILEDLDFSLFLKYCLNRRRVFWSFQHYSISTWRRKTESDTYRVQTEWSKDTQNWRRVFLAFCIYRVNKLKTRNWPWSLSGWNWSTDSWRSWLNWLVIQPDWQVNKNSTWCWDKAELIGNSAWLTSQR